MTARFQASSVPSRLVFPIILAIVFVMGAVPAHADVALNIIPTFAANITSDPNAAAIEATINSAIAFYQSTFTTHTAAPIGVTIDFQEGGGLGASNTTLYKVSYSSFSAALNGATSGDPTDTSALSGLPVSGTNPVTGSSTINVKTAELRALGYTGVPPIGGFDGVITLNTSITTPGGAGPYSLLAVVEHEIDEVLGLGSDLGQANPFFNDPAPEDLFRYAAGGARSYTTNPAALAYFSLTGAIDLAQFDNQNDGGDWGDWQSNPRAPGVGPKVQDAFATPGSTPFLDRTSPETIALDAMGYNLSAVSTAPEPTSVILLGSVLAIIGIVLKRRGGLSTNQS
jgi:hypothetical protein